MPPRMTVPSLWLRMGLLVGRTRSHSQRLFPFERVFDTADGVLNLALNLVGLALRLQLGVTGRLADRLLHCAFDLLRRSNDPVLVHMIPSSNSKALSGGQ